MFASYGFNHHFALKNLRWWWSNPAPVELQVVQILNDFSSMSTDYCSEWFTEFYRSQNRAGIKPPWPGLAISLQNYIVRVVDFFPTKNISRNQLPKALSMEICWQIDGFGQNLPPPSWAKAWTISVCPCWQSRWTWSFGVLALDLRFRWCCDTFCIFCQGSNHQFGEYWVNGCFLDITIWRKSRFIDTPQQLNEETVQIHHEVEPFFCKIIDLCWIAITPEQL